MPDDDVKPWTIKNIGPEDRNAAIAAAHRENATIGEWLARAIRSQIQIEMARGRAPAVVEATPLPAPVAQINLDDMARLVEMAGQISAFSGKPVPRTITRSMVKLVRSRLDALAGVPRLDKAA